MNSLELAPDTAWDFSEAGDRSVLAWKEGAHLYIAGEGGVKAPVDSSELFGYDADAFGYGAIKLQQITFNNGFDTSEVQNMYAMFGRCTVLENVDFYGFDTSQVQNMSGMFRECSSLTSLDVSDFNTSGVTNMSAMFLGCSSLKELDVSGFDMSYANTFWMFNGTIWE